MDFFKEAVPQLIPIMEILDDKVRRRCEDPSVYIIGNDDRVHMAHIGCPLAGDWLYGTEAPDLISRPALHAYALALTHPVTGTHLYFTAPTPADMEKLI